MRKLLMVGAVVAAVAIPTASHAQFTLGLRLGYAPAMGDMAKSADGSTSWKMSDFVGSQIPLQFDAMYRFTPEWAAGLYFSYGFGQVTGTAKDLCNSLGEDCSASAMRFGVQGTYTFTTVSPTFVPWAGLGIGYETVTLKESIGGASGTTDFSGWEYLNLQLGGDYKVNPKFAVGPYVMFSLNQFSNIEGNSIPEKSMHEWFHIGLRGKFDL